VVRAISLILNFKKRVVRVGLIESKELTPSKLDESKMSICLFVQRKSLSCLLSLRKKGIMGTTSLFKKC
jgi:hypothetical protein